MPIKLSYNQAIAIQKRQMLWYRQAIGLSGVRSIKASTHPCPSALHPDKPISIIAINELVPRGGCFERYLTGTKAKRDPLTADYYKAMERGIYDGAYIQFK